MVCFVYIIVNILHKSDNDNNNNNNKYIFGHCMRPNNSKYNPSSFAETFLGLFYLSAKLLIFLWQMW